MTTSGDSITMSTSEAYRFRTVLNYLLKGQDLNINGIEGRLNGNEIVISTKRKK